MPFQRLLERLLGGSSHDLQRGAVLDGHYRVIRTLGKGAWSAVYEVESLVDGRRYALKQTNIQALGDADRASVLNELRLLASLRSPNVVSYHEAWASQQGQLSCVLELVDGGDLARVLADAAERREREEPGGGRIPEGEIWSYLLQAARGLAHLHSHSIVHRDVKPANLLLDAHGVLKVADLGVASVLARERCEVVKIGTAGFMPPEVYRRDACQSTAADIWSLGVVAFQLCCLRTPFAPSARSEAAVEAAAAAWSTADAAASAAAMPAAYSGELRRLLQAMLQPDPAARPTAQQILDSHGAFRLSSLPASSTDACGQPWTPRSASGASVRRVLPPIELTAEMTDDFALLNSQLPGACCGRLGSPRGVLRPAPAEAAAALGGDGAGPRTPLAR